MMGQHDRSESLFYYFRIEDQVPENHLLRLIDRTGRNSRLRENTSSNRVFQHQLPDSDIRPSQCYYVAVQNSEEDTMNREAALRVVLVIVGVIFLLGAYPLMMFLWPSGWRWQPNQPEYEQMILGVYATLGIFLLLASRNPSGNRSLIAFTAWSSLVHGVIMAVQAFQNASERGHLFGDIPALIGVGIALLALAPAKESAERTSAAPA